jgi:hypothetical protein
MANPQNTLRRRPEPKSASRTTGARRPPGHQRADHLLCTPLRQARPRAWSLLVPFPLGGHTERNKRNGLSTTYNKKERLCGGLRPCCSSRSTAKSEVSAGRKVAPPTLPRRPPRPLFWLSQTQRRPGHAHSRPPRRRQAGCWVRCSGSRSSPGATSGTATDTTRSRRRGRGVDGVERSRWRRHHSQASRRLQGGFDSRTVRLTAPEFCFSGTQRAAATQSDRVRYAALFPLLSATLCGAS